MTELLFQLDSYLRAFDASVRAVDGARVALDRTAFYPTGGGQPHDLGWLCEGDRRLEVVEVRREGEHVWHRLREQALEPTCRVRGEIDWERRYQLMRTHTALHILSGVIWRDHRAPVTGGNMEPLRGRLDFELDEIPADFAPRVEAAVNAEIRDARPIEVRILPRDEAMQIPDLIRTKINLLPPGIRQIRTVHIVGLDLQADGGTHVRNTSEVGCVRVLGYKSKGKSNKRLRIEVTDA
ncbi:MAG: alanyl-tRNA editing protein [Candidatus Latescibacterota bacterium]|nr:MAG: alanyl-tRNA editing protein [Candidatus Latescibacterota bacterium]